MLSAGRASAWARHERMGGARAAADDMEFHALISCIFCIYSLKYNHKCMLSRFKMIKLIISMF